MGEEGEGFTGTLKGHMDNNKEGWKRERVWGVVGGKGRKLYLNNNKKY